MEYNGMEYPSLEDEVYLKAKAEAEERAKEEALQPTITERIEALEEMLLAMEG